LKKRSGKPVKAKARTRVQPRADRKGEASSHRAVFLVGFMGAGKSSVGRALGQRLNWDFEDLDDRIEQRERRAVADIFRDSGEQGFRRSEHLALRHLLDDLQGRRIVALGGGAFVQKKNSALLETAGVPTIFLDAPVAELWIRCSKQAEEAGTKRPLLRSEKQFRALYEERRKSYGKASVLIQTGNRTVDAIAEEIAKTLRLKVRRRVRQGDVE
jgi:shikimate kinase